MLDFNTFKVALLELKEIHERSMLLSEVLGTGVIEFTAGLETILLQVLEETSQDSGDWIGWWLYEDVSKIITLKNGSEVDLTTPVALYNFLVMEADYGKDA